MNTPTISWSPVRWAPAIRVTAQEYTLPTVFDLVADGDDDAIVAGLVADVTNPVSNAGMERFLSLPLEERTVGYGAGLILGPFCFSTAPSRFSDGQRGVWYGASTLPTAVAERAYHTTRTLRDSHAHAASLDMAVVHTTPDGYLADIRGQREALPDVYDSTSYVASQAFAADQRHRGAYGIVYDSTRHCEGACVAVFRPSVLRDARVVKRVRWMWDEGELRVSG